MIDLLFDSDPLPDVNKKDKFGRTALQIAVRTQNLIAINKLLGINSGVTNYRGKTNDKN